MNRLIACGLTAILSLPVILSGCGPSIGEQRDLAISQFNTNHFDEAERQLKQIVYRQPDAESYYYLGRVYHIEAQYSKAIFNYQNCLTIDPSYVPAQMWLKRALEDYPAGKTLLFIHLPGETTAQP